MLDRARVGSILLLVKGSKKPDRRHNLSIKEVVMNDKKKAYEEKLDAQLKEWNAQINLLQAKANNAKADAKIEYIKTIEVLQRKQNEAKTKLQELKAAGDEAWEDIKAGAEKAWGEVRTAFRDATARFK
jgi:multidrug resistance efflux pump